MLHETKKIAKLIDEIITCFLYNYGADIAIKIKRTGDAHKINFTFSNLNINDKQYEKLKNRLVVKRQPELEDYYWQLTGEIESSNELMLVAMMSDRIELKRDNNTVYLDIERKKR